MGQTVDMPYVSIHSMSSHCKAGECKKVIDIKKSLKWKCTSRVCKRTAVSYESVISTVVEEITPKPTFDFVHKKCIVSLCECM